MENSWKYVTCFQIKLVLLFFLFISSATAQEELQRINLKKHRYLITADTIIYSNSDTVVKLQYNTEFKIRRNITPFLSRKYPKLFIQEFYKPESESSVKEDTVLYIKSEDPYINYEKKIIRSIVIQRVGVSGPKVPNGFRNSEKLDSIIDKLHEKTREWVIKDYLFFELNDTLNSYLLADNERFLRNQPFIHDARIIIDTLNSKGDSVAILVITKDVWSLSGSSIAYNFDINNPHYYNNYEAEVYDANFLGGGQRIQLNMLYDYKRHPPAHIRAYYKKYNIFHTFIDGTIGYSTNNGGASLGGEKEESYYLQFYRPLFSPSAKFSGGLQLSQNRAINVFEKTDLDFRKYRYFLLDAWSAYSLKSSKRLIEKEKSRNERFFSARFVRQYFEDKPHQTSEITNPAYNNRWIGITTFSFFRENFFKTRYVLGFGKTEDISYGYFISLNGGYDYRLNRHRYYTGIEFEKTNVWKKGRFSSIQITVGGYHHKKNIEDIAIHFNGTLYSRLHSLSRLKFRQQLFTKYSIGLKSYFYGPIGINGENGIYGFNSYTIYGFQRFILRAQSTCWIPLKIYGFRFAFFASGEFASVGSNQKLITTFKMYSGIGGGLKVRNENLIFKMMQFKAYYYPSTQKGMQNYFLELSTSFEMRITKLQLHTPSFISFQ